MNNSTLPNASFSPQISSSSKYKHWVSVDDFIRCLICATYHGKIWFLSEIPNPEPPIHSSCRCSIQPMQAIKSGTATINGLYGADFYLLSTGSLPDYYISQIDLEQRGWRRGKKVSKYATDMMLFGGIYNNDDNRLPQAPGRIWYEADINYIRGKRNNHRILWSNDGLIFVTYDHYNSFYEICNQE